jgi:hypothetical protein
MQGFRRDIVRDMRQESEKTEILTAAVIKTVKE